MDDEKKKQERDDVIDAFAGFAQTLFLILFIALLPVESSVYTEYLIAFMSTGVVALAFFKLGRSLLKEDATILQIIRTIALLVVSIFI